MADLHAAEITALLGRVRDGDADARHELLPLVEWRRARAWLERELVT